MDNTLSRLEAVQALRKYGSLELIEPVLDDEGNDFTTRELRLRDGKVILETTYDDNAHEEELTWKQCLFELSKFDRFPVVFVNAYELNQCYGGPEEGGWWYDAGTLLGSTPVIKRGDNVDRAISHMNAIYKEEYDAQRERTSAAGGADLMICITDKIGEDYSNYAPYE